MTNTVSKWLPAGLAPFERSALSFLSMMQSPVRIEERLDGKSYVLRAEVPGVDPTKDLTVTYHDGTLRLQIHRADVRKDMATDARVVTISPEGLARPGGHYSHARRFGDLVFTHVAKMTPSKDYRRHAAAVPR